MSEAMTAEEQTHTPSESEQDELSVRSLLLPLSGGFLLVPNTAVAEVTSYVSPTAVPEAPAWLRGMVSWRGHLLPMISFEALLGEAPDRSEGDLRMAVFNTLNGTTELPFLAVRISGIPRLLQASRTGVVRREQAGASQAGVLSRVSVGGVDAVIPDLDVLERLLLNLGIKSN